MDRVKLAELRRLVDGRETKKTHRQLRVLGGICRFRILVLLKLHGEPLNVTQIANILRVSCSTVSHDLRTLRQHGLVRSSSRGREVHYRSNGGLDGLKLTQ